MSETPPAKLAFDETPPDLQEMLKPTVDRLGYFGDFFAYAAQSPDVLKGFMQFSAALKKALPDDVNEALALSMCDRLDFPYERIQHERLSEKLGFDRDWIANMAGRGGEAAKLTDLQAAAKRLGHAVASGHIAEARQALAAIAASEGDELAVATLFQATRYQQICVLGRTLDMQLPVASIFGDA